MGPKIWWRLFLELKSAMIHLQATPIQISSAWHNWTKHSEKMIATTIMSPYKPALAHHKFSLISTIPLCLVLIVKVLGETHRSWARKIWPGSSMYHDNYVFFNSGISPTFLLLPTQLWEMILLIDTFNKALRHDEQSLDSMTSFSLIPPAHRGLFRGS